MDNLISICITCYNAQETITNAILSAQKQTYKNREIIIYDDASNDNSISILKELNSKYPELKIIYNAENKGVAHARNELVKAANGDFIFFFDDDDESVPNRLEIQLKNLQEQININKTNNIISLCSRKQLLDDSIHIELSPVIDSILKPEDLIIKALKGWNIKNFVGSCATCSLAAPAKVLKGLKFDSNFRRKEDTDLFIRHAKGGGLIYGDSSVLVTQVLTSGEDKNHQLEHGFFILLLKKHKDLISDREISFLKRFSLLKLAIISKEKTKAAKHLFFLISNHPILLAKKSYAIFKSKNTTIQRLSYLRSIDD